MNRKFDELLGLTQEQVNAKVSTGEVFGVKKVRVIRIDNQGFAGICDYRMDRLNLEIDGGKVTKASIG